MYTCKDEILFGTVSYWGAGHIPILQIKEQFLVIGSFRPSSGLGCRMTAL